MMRLTGITRATPTHPNASTDSIVRSRAMAFKGMFWLPYVNMRISKNPARAVYNAKRNALQRKSKSMQDNVSASEMVKSLAADQSCVPGYQRISSEVGSVFKIRSHAPTRYVPSGKPRMT